MTTPVPSLRRLACLVALSFVVPGCTSPSPDRAATTGAEEPHRRSALHALGAKPRPIAARALGALPLAFERKEGDGGVRFLGRGPGHTVAVTPGETILGLRNDVPAAPGAALRMRLVGGAAEPELSASEPLGGTANHLVGSDRSQWRTGVPLFGKVRARDVYPGIDVVYYGNGRQLEHDFVVAPGADPSRIRIAFAGQSAPLSVDEHGDLVVLVPGGEVLQKAPVTYQERGGRREAVAARYVVHDGDAESGRGQEIGFAVDPFDDTLPLIIDPILVYSTYLGGDGNDGYGVTSIAVDASGSVYVTGSTASSDFPTEAPLQASNAGSADAFVTKLTPDGSGLVYSTYLGGGNVDFGVAIAVDDAGSAYVFGLTLSADFPTESAFQAIFGGGPQDNFVAKLSPSGDALVYSTYLGGTGFEVNMGDIAVDAAGSAYVGGATYSTNFPTQSPMPISGGGGGDMDLYVAKLAPNGASLVYSTYLGGSSSGEEVATGIAVDGAGSAYVTGYTDSLDFPMKTPFQGTCTAVCAFVTKLAPAGTALAYSTYLGGGFTTASYAEGIAVDAAGSAYVVGLTSDAAFPTTPGAFQTSRQGLADAFVTKLTPAGTQLAYSTLLGGSGEDYGYGIAVDGAGGAFVVGETGSSNFPLASPSQPAIAAAPDAFVARLNATGSALSFSTYLGGAAGDFAYEVATRPAPGAGGSFVAAYVGGDTTSSDFPTRFPFETEPGDSGLYDSFVTKLAHGQAQTQQAVAAGGTASIATVLVDVSVTSPNAGNVTIVGGLAVGAPGGAIELDITAPTATAVNPLVLRFLIHPPNASGFVAAIRNLNRLGPCTGAPGTASPDPCIASTTPQLSGDLEIIVNTSAASLWTLADTSTTPVCPPSPTSGCQPAQSTKSQLHLQSKADDSKDKLGWKWQSSATVDVPDFGSPSSTTGYQLCLYTQNTLRAAALMPAAGTCSGHPCWRSLPTGFLYSDKDATPLGLSKMTMKAGAPGKAKIGISGKGANLPDTPLPLALPAKIQLIRIDDGTCWEATYSTAKVARPDLFKATSD
ncbi:MAG TPA: SBBP repeat-containing protein [Candidatus Binatia bacterium]|nr:SBBP repeat-containing protein [Candidatus Binatia bacterium]